jgi:ABC-2 type transport system permease protein
VTAVGTGAVYDRGYRPYDGPRGGRRAARSALYRASVRRALGLRRSWRQKVAPFVLLGIAVIPAIVNVGATYLAKDTVGSDIQFFTYREYVGVSNSLLVFVALVAPDLLCPDRRQRVLPLYFARPLKGVDYVAAKLGAMTSILPQVVLFIGQMLVSDDGSLSYARHNLDVLWKVPLAVGLLSIFFSTLGLALASLSSRRIIAGATIVGVFLVTSIVSSVLVGDTGSSSTSTGTANGVVISRFVAVPPGSRAALLDVWGLPLVLRDLVFLGHVSPTGELNRVSGAGISAVVLFVLLVVLAGATLLVRYNEVDK